MQIYKGMSVATAAPTSDEIQGIPHHLVEFLDPDECFSVADFVALAKEKITDIKSRNKNPIIVGGTGLFIDSLVKNLEFSDVSANQEFRNSLENKTNDELYEMLLKVDDIAAKDIHKNNRKRVIRALELCYGGTTKTEQNINSTKNESPYDALYIGINYKNRQTLYDRINLRVDLMINDGIINEAKSFLNKDLSTARQAIGHKELMPYIKDEMPLEEAVENLKKETRHYAKRQLTWFRRNENINWLYMDELGRNNLISKAIEISKDFLEK